MSAGVSSLAAFFFGPGHRPEVGFCRSPFDRKPSGTNISMYRNDFPDRGDGGPRLRGHATLRDPGA